MRYPPARADAYARQRCDGVCGAGCRGMRSVRDDSPGPVPLRASAGSQRQDGAGPLGMVIGPTCSSILKLAHFQPRISLSNLMACEMSRARARSDGLLDLTWIGAYMLSLHAFSLLRSAAAGGAVLRLRFGRAAWVGVVMSWIPLLPLAPGGLARGESLNKQSRV